ncbi:phage tail tape measure protein, partial [Pseudomonas syringae pv. pisi]
ALMNTTAFQWISDQMAKLSSWFDSMGGWSGIAKTAWDSILSTVKGAINGLIEMANKIPGINIETTFGDLPEPPKVPDLPGQVGAPVPGPQLPAVVTTPPAGTVPGAVARSAPVQGAAARVQVKPAPPISLPQPNVLPFKPLQMLAPQISQADPIMLPSASADLEFSMPAKTALPERVEKVIELPAKSDKGIEARKAINANTSISPTKPQAVPKGGLMQSFQNQSNAMNPNQRPGTHVETLNINTSK